MSHRADLAEVEGPTGLRSFRYHAWRGNLSREEVRDGPHSDNRCGGNRCSVATTAAPLSARVGALRGCGLFVFSNGIPIEIKSLRALVVRPLLPPVWRAQRAQQLGQHCGSALFQPPVLVAPASILGSERSVTCDVIRLVGGAGVSHSRLCSTRVVLVGASLAVRKP